MILQSEHIFELLRDTGWMLKGKSIIKTFKFNSFIEAIQFVTSVAATAEDQNHHPDIEIHYNRVKLSLTTHDEGGVTNKDIDLANDINELE